MGLFVELLGTDAVLHESKAYLCQGKACFLQNFASEGVFGGLARFYLAARNSPQPRPFQGVNHQQLLVGADDQRPHGGSWGKSFRCGVAAEDFYDGKHVRSNMVGKGPLEFLERVVACQNGAGADIAVPGGLDVMFHVPDKQGFIGVQMVIGQNRVDGFPLVRNPGVGFVEVVVDPKAFGLVEKIVPRDTA